MQGISAPRDEPSDHRKAEGYSGFRRFACKIATRCGKTTAMGMLAAWSILNKSTVTAAKDFFREATAWI